MPVPRDRVRHVTIIGTAVLLATLGLIGAPGAGAQQAASRAELETRLPELTGVERARTLSRLVDAYRLDQPERALEYGREALRLFENHTEPVAHISTLNEMGWAHMTLSRYDSATAYLERAREMGGRLGDRAGEARALSNLGTLAQRVGDPNRAVALFAEALQIQRDLGADADVATSLNNLGYVYSVDLADYGRSLAYHTEALAIRERLGNRADVSLSLNNIGIVHGRLRQHDRALAYFERALEIRRELGQQTRIAATLHNIGDVHLEAGDPRRALEYHREALEVRESLEDPSAVALSRATIGQILLAMGEPDSARAELLTALRMGERIGDRGLNARTLIWLSEVERADGRPAAAEAHARRALELAEAMGSREMVRRATAELGAAQEQHGDLAGALATLKRSHDLADSIFTEETSHRIAELERLIIAEQQTAELERLRRDEAHARLQATQRGAQRNAVAGAALLLGLAGVFMFRRRAERARFAESASVTDPLTGVRNRRYLEQTIPMDVAASLRRYRSAAERGELPIEADLVLLLLDIDDFKRVNDEIGHAAGDRLLQSVAAAIQSVVRDSEVVIRLGGDEFLVIMRFCDRAQAPVVAERLRREISDLRTTLPGGRTLRATCSVGFAAFPFDPVTPSAHGWQDVLAIADAGTYAAKRDGRDRWVGHSIGEGLPPEGADWDVATVDRLVAEDRIVRQASNAPGTYRPAAPGIALPAEA